MNFYKYLVIIGLLVFSAIEYSYAQPEKKLMKEAEKAYQDGQKEAALDFYLKAHKIDPNNVGLNYNIGKLYLQTIHKEKSLSYLQKAYQGNPKLPGISFLLGEAYHYNLKFDEAINYYEESKQKNTKDPKALKNIERKIYECENGKEFVANPVDVKIENMGPQINTKYPEYAPIVSADESILIFTSRREGSTGGFLDQNGDYYEDIYMSEKIDGKWTPPRSISSVINTTTHDASIGLSPDGKELFIYKDDGNGDIYTCNMKKDGTWSKPQPVDINNKKNYENAAAITPDGKKLFFTSDRDGGYGDLDIYVVEKDANGKWGEPKNLGPEVNTEGSEEAPFLDLDGKTLYFASNRHKGMGDFDIFRTIYDPATKTWSKADNLGYPINSPDEDLYFALSGDGRHAFFASAKEDGYGDKDLYMITMPPREDYEDLVTKVEAISGKTIVKEKVDKLEPVEAPAPVEEPKDVVLQPVVIKGEVTEVGTHKPLIANVQIVDQAQKPLYTVTTGEDGSYRFEIPIQEAMDVTVSAEKDQYGFNSRKITTPAPGPEMEVVEVDLALKKLEVGSTFILRNIYFDFDQATIKSESEPELKKLLNMLNTNPSLKIEIGGHTDFIGSNEYNKELSQRRADAVVNYLVEHGIDRSRLTAKGYGEERPLASNDDENEGRELNRRTEFEVKGK